MAFDIQLISGETCYICGKKDVYDQLEIAHSTRDDKNFLIVHVSCLTKKINKARGIKS